MTKWICQVHKQIYEEKKLIKRSYKFSPRSRYTSCLVINTKANGKDRELLEYSTSRTTWTWGCSSKTARRLAQLAVIYMQAGPTGSYVQIFTRWYYGRKKRNPKTKLRSTTRNWRPIEANLLWMLMNFLLPAVLVALGNLGNVLLLIHMGLVLPEYTQQTRCWIKNIVLGLVYHIDHRSFKTWMT